jgi:hypothetical protein
MIRHHQVAALGLEPHEHLGKSLLQMRTTSAISNKKLMPCLCCVCTCCIYDQVAALGLEPHKHLGKSLVQMRAHLHRLRDRFGCNVCGEGGEYETLTLDCPAFTRGHIVLDSWEVRGTRGGGVVVVGTGSGGGGGGGGVDGRAVL